MRILLRMKRVALNLSLDPRVIEAAQRFAESHDRSLSNLVEELLRRVTGLPDEDKARAAIEAAASGLARQRSRKPRRK